MLLARGIGCIAFSPLAQGLLTSRYLRDIPAGSRAAKPHGFLKANEITDSRRAQIQALNAIAMERGQSLAQLAITWVLRQPAMTSALVGASSVKQVEENVAALHVAPLTDDELQRIDAVLAEPAGVA